MSENNFCNCSTTLGTAKIRNVVTLGSHSLKWDREEKDGKVIVSNVALAIPPNAVYTVEMAKLGFMAYILFLPQGELLVRAFRNVCQKYSSDQVLNLTQDTFCGLRDTFVEQAKNEATGEVDPGVVEEWSRGLSLLYCFYQSFNYNYKATQTELVYCPEFLPLHESLQTRDKTRDLMAIKKREEESQKASAQAPTGCLVPLALVLGSITAFCVVACCKLI